MLLLLTAAGCAATACTLIGPPHDEGTAAGAPRAAPPPAPTPTPAPAPPAPPPPAPTPPDNRKSWTISAAHFRDGGGAIWAETSNRSEPFASELVAAGNVRVSIGGNELPLTSTAYQPAFTSDLSGAEWTVRAEVRVGAVVLVLEAPDQSRVGVASVTLTSPGSGYTSAPTVTFSGGGGRGAAAEATAADSVASVTIIRSGYDFSASSSVVFSAPASGTTATGTINRGTTVWDIDAVTYGSGYTSVPTVTFTGGGGSGAAATATVTGGIVSDYVLTDRGSGYTSVPTIAVTGGGGSGATAKALGARAY